MADLGGLKLAAARGGAEKFARRLCALVGVRSRDKVFCKTPAPSTKCSTVFSVIPVIRLVLKMLIG